MPPAGKKILTRFLFRNKTTALTREMRFRIEANEATYINPCKITYPKVNRIPVQTKRQSAENSSRFTSANSVCSLLINQIAMAIEKMVNIACASILLFSKIKGRLLSLIN